ncbi:uncharacterized protein LOC134241672 [Saccostrea cucullata]|uniref:uncharacterized protein LOC134241672 n=1 Tax=Saccostrea cuccullata TaxID=36930 RepID=UPI002ED30B9E
MPNSKVMRLGESSAVPSKASDQIGECNDWLHTSVKAKTEQSMKLVHILCEWPRMDLPITKGTGNILGYNIASLFEKNVKTKLKEMLELEEGDKRCYEPHWRHLRWIDRNDLTDHNVMNNNVCSVVYNAFHMTSLAYFVPGNCSMQVM